MLRELLQEAVGEVLSSEASAPELLSRFTGVYVQDGTIISLPPELRDEWRGCGGNTPDAGQSSMRVQVRLDLAQGGMQGPWLQAGRAAERSGEAHEAPLPQGCLYNVDAGYFTLGEMRAHGQAGQSRAGQAATGERHALCGGQTQGDTAAQCAQTTGSRGQTTPATQAAEDGQGPHAVAGVDDPADQRAAGATKSG